MAHLMIDIESLNTTPDTVILTIGAVLFDPKGMGVLKTIDIRPDVDEQIAMGRSISEDTLRWWGTQSQAAQDEAFGDQGRVPFKEAMETLYKFSWNADRVWGHGAAFDPVVMEDAWTSLDIKIPWNFYHVRDTRTLFELTGVSLKDGGYITTHKASEDAARQAQVVQDAYRILMKAGVVKR
jgi:hypothetical protein